MGASLRKSGRVLSELILRGGLLSEQLGERLLRTLQVGNLRLGFLQISGKLRNFTGRATCTGVLQGGLRRKQIGAGLRELGFRIGVIQDKNDLSAMNTLTFRSHYFLDEGGKLRAGGERRNRLNLSITGDGGGQILARYLGDGNFRGLAASGDNDYDDESKRRGQSEHDPFSIVLFRHA